MNRSHAPHSPLSACKDKHAASFPKRLRPSDSTPLASLIQDTGEEARCYRVIRETYPITKSVLISHLERLWFNCGAEYRFIHSTPDPHEKPLIRFPPREDHGQEFHPVPAFRWPRTDADRTVYLSSQAVIASTSNAVAFSDAPPVPDLLVGDTGPSERSLSPPHFYFISWSGRC